MMKACRGMAQIDGGRQHAQHSQRGYRERSVGRAQRTRELRPEHNRGHQPDPHGV